jgi:putative ABC transport system substrate-binding protein
VRDLDAAFKQAAGQRLGAVIATQSPFFANENARIAQLGIMHRMPVISGEPSFPEAGGLMTYGPNVPDLWRRAASYVDKVLKGESPATLPVEQPTKFDLLINLKTAKRLGLTIPQSVLIRADKVIG